ncbi:MAG: heme-binding protein [Gaiellaceae bacterium]
MPLSLTQAHVLIAAANDHALANGWKIAVAVVDEGAHLVALGRMDGAFIPALGADRRSEGSRNGALAPRRRAAGGQPRLL